MCGVEGGCSVCKCDEKDIPLPWKVSKKDRVNTFLDTGMAQKKWVDNSKDLWFPKQHEEKMTYVNLALNPETNTGYSGAEANRVWKAIYTENCFKCMFCYASIFICSSWKAARHVSRGTCILQTNFRIAYFYYPKDCNILP
jgi:hypothetical protein